MIPIKTPKEIKTMKAGGRRLAGVLDQVLTASQPGVELKELEQLAVELIKKTGGWPSFKMVKGYRWATCLSVNQGVVHGVPSQYRLEKGDLLSADVGLFYQDFHSDMARTIEIGGATKKNKKFLEAGRKALKKASRLAQPGNRVGQISAAIEKVIKGSGYSPIKTLTGHGLGRKLHEEPAIPCFLKGELEKTPKLKSGMCLAIEVIYSQGEPEIVAKKDGWTLETADGRPAALFENSLAVTKKGPLVLTAG